MVVSANRYTGSHLLMALAFGVLLGAFTEPIWMYFTAIE